MTPREQLLIDAPSRPKLREPATVVRALAAFGDKLLAFWPTVDGDKLQAEIVTAVLSTTNTWDFARWLEALGRSFNHDVYMASVGFWRSLESARIEREIEWVMKHGVRFPASAGQQVVFSCRGARLTGVVKEVDRRRARGIVEAKRYGGAIENFSVEAEYVMMVAQ